jgi:hypothetical protein
VQRREFITLVCGVAFAWPRAARAQQTARRIGVLMNGAPDDAEVRARLAAFLDGCNSWAGPTAGTCESTLAGLATSGSIAARRN